MEPLEYISIDLPPKKQKIHHIAKNLISLIKGIAGLALGLSIMILCYIFRNEIQEASLLGYLGLFIGCLISNSSVLLPSSASLLVIGAASALNPFLCGLIGGVGASLGEQVSYWMGRSGKVLLEETAMIKKLQPKIEKHGFAIVFWFAFIPLPIYDIAGVAAGLGKMKWTKYTIACALGKIPKMILYAYIGLAVFLWLINLIENQGITFPGSNMVLEKLKEIFSTTGG